jgi:hypothetical protein
MFSAAGRGCCFAQAPPLRSGAPRRGTLDRRSSTVAAAATPPRRTVVHPCCGSSESARDALPGRIPLPATKGEGRPQAAAHHSGGVTPAAAQTTAPPPVRIDTASDQLSPAARTPHAGPAPNHEAPRTAVAVGSRCLLHRQVADQPPGAVRDVRCRMTARGSRTGPCAGAPLPSDGWSTVRGWGHACAATVLDLRSSVPLRGAPERSGGA